MSLENAKNFFINKINKQIKINEMKTTINIEGKEFTIEQLKELIRCDQGDPVHLALQSGEELDFPFLN